MMTTYCFITFNIVSVEENFTLGYATIGIVGLYIFVCLLVILKNVFVVIRDKLRRWRAMRSFKSKRKQLKINLKSTKPKRVELMRNIRK